MRKRKNGVGPVIAALLIAMLFGGCGQTEVPVPEEELKAHNELLKEWDEDYQNYQDELAAQRELLKEENKGKKRYNANFYYDNTKSMMGFVNTPLAVTSPYVDLIRESGNILKAAAYIDPSGISAYRLKKGDLYLEWMECSLSSEIMAGFTKVNGNMYTASDEEGSLERKADGVPIGPLSMLFSNEEGIDPSAITIIVTDMLEQGFEYDSMLERINQYMDCESDFGVAVLGAYSDYFGDVTFTSYANQGLAEVTVRNFDRRRAFFVIVLGPAEGVLQYYQDMSGECERLFGEWGSFYCDNREVSEAEQEIIPVPIQLRGFELQDSLYDKADVEEQRKLADKGQVLGSLNLNGSQLTKDETEYKNAFLIEKSNLLSFSTDDFILLCSLMDNSFQPEKQAVVYQQYPVSAESEEEEMLTLQDRIRKAEIKNGMTCYDIWKEGIVFKHYNEESGNWEKHDETIKSEKLSAGLYQMDGVQTELGKTMLGAGEHAAYLRVELNDDLETGYYYLSIPVAASVYQDNGDKEISNEPPSEEASEDKEGILCNMGTTAGDMADAVEKLTFLNHESNSHSLYYSWSSTDESVRKEVADTLGKAVDLQYIVKGIKRHYEDSVQDDTYTQEAEQLTDRYLYYVDFIIKMK